MSWLQQGDITKVEKPTSTGKFAPFAWGLKSGETKKFVFVSDSKSPAVHFHEIWSDNRPSRVLCNKPMGEPCEWCNLATEKGDKRLGATKNFIFTVIDLTPYKNKEGAEIPFSRKPMFVKEQTARKLFQPMLLCAQEDYGQDFPGLLVRATRSDDDKAPRVGDSFSILKAVKLSEYDDPKPFSEDEIMEQFLTDPEKLAELMAKFRGGKSSAKADWSEVE